MKARNYLKFDKNKQVTIRIIPIHHEFRCIGGISMLNGIECPLCEAGLKAKQVNSKNE